MKKTLIFLQSAIISCTAFADYEDYYAQDVSGKDFSSKSLVNSTWDYATAEKTKFCSSDLTNSYFSGANLTSADFSKANLTNVDFSDAIIKGANFTKVEGFTKEQLYSTASYKNKNLSGVNFEYCNLSGWNFAGQDLSSYIGFVDANLTNANLSGAILENKQFLDSNLTDANFENAIIKGADFYKATGFTKEQLYSTASYKNKYLWYVGFKGLDLSGWSFAGQTLDGVNFSSTSLNNADFTDATIYSMVFDHSDFSAQQLYSTASYKRNTLNYINFNGCSLSGWNFIGQNLTYSSFQYADLTNANFARARLENVIFFGAKITGANFHETTAKGFTKEQLYDTKSYKDQDLSNVNFSKNDFSGWILYNINLENTNFENTNLTGANLGASVFANANLKNANLSKASLDSANFALANLSNANFTDATIKYTSFSGATSNGFTKVQLYSTANYKNKDLTQVDLSNNDLRGWNFDGQNLAYVNFSGADLTDASISKAKLFGVVSKGFTKEQLYSTANYKNKDLSGIMFSSKDYFQRDQDFSGWSFSGQNLQDAGFVNANLTNVDFSNANLSNVSLKNATLTDANFENAIINGAYLDLGTFTKEQLYSTASYKNKDLAGVIFSEGFVYDLSNWNFEGQNLQNIKLTGSSLLTNTNFRKADLRGAKLGPNIAYATLRNTIDENGYIKRFSMTSSSSSFSIRKYVPETDDGEIISAKISASATIPISGGAELTLETGARLEVMNDTFLAVKDSSSIIINTDADSSTYLSVASGAGLSFEDDAILKINVEGNFIASDTYTIAVISWGDDSRMTGLNDFMVDETLFLSVNGVARHGNWSYVIENNKMLINFVAVPEPATFAAIFGLLALGFAVRRNLKRK